jgi:hypothetical protein
MHRFCFAFCLGLTTCASVVALPAHAFDNMANTAINNMMLGTQIPVMNNAIMSGVLEEMAGEAGEPSPPSQSALQDDGVGLIARDAPPLSIDMRGAEPHIAQAHQEFLGLVGDADLQAIEEIRSLLASGDVRREFQSLLRSVSLNPEDLADAMTAHIIVMWAIVNERLDGNADPNGVRAVSQQFGPLFRADPGLQSLSPAERAAVFETIAALSLMAIGAQTDLDNRHEVVALEEFRSTVNLYAQEIGWPDLRRMELTQRGFQLQ